MTQLTTTQVASLKNSIYNLLMQNPEMDMGDMGECEQAADQLIDTWMDENNIQVIAED